MRMDTVEGYNDLYDEEAPDDGSDFNDSFKYGSEEDKVPVNMDELEDEQEDLLGKAETGVPSKLSDDYETCSDTGSTLNFKAGLFAVKESKDKGLADIETGSEVYMSELLVSVATTNNFRMVLTWRTSMKQKSKTRRICWH